jgi:muconolactone D-isomerase
MEARRHVTVTCSPAGDRDVLSRRRAAEAVRAREPAGAGRPVRPWRPVGEPRSIDRRRARDEEELRERAFGTLPSSSWMTFTVTAVRSHPGDPGRPGDVSA